ncbi:MAG: hypothetical protein JW829_20660 [Pirellulales bacterium]|nr:hypothetical protein [Pirellulales bacterium]
MGIVNRDIRPVACCILMFLQIGCAEDDQIKRYRVAKQSPSNDSVESESPIGFLGAIIPHGKQAWFLKVIGRSDILQTEMDNFRSFVRSIRFPGSDSTKLSWELPAGWQEFPATGIRYATLKFGPIDNPLELSVTALPAPEGNPDDFVLANINRWRHQVGVPPITMEQLPASVELIPLESATATIVRFPGQTVGNEMAVPPVDKKGNLERNPETSPDMQSLKSQHAEGAPNGK